MTGAEWLEDCEESTPGTREICASCTLPVKGVLACCVLAFAIRVRCFDVLTCPEVPEVCVEVRALGLDDA